MDLCRTIGIVALLIEVAGASNVLAQEAILSGGAGRADGAPSHLQMPLVSPEAGLQFQGARVAPKSDVPPLQADPKRRIDEKVLTAAPVLGHEPPTTAMTPSGHKRADFAIARAGAAGAKSALGQGGSASGARPDGLGSAVINRSP